jgi:hypothetical protein
LCGKIARVFCQLTHYSRWILPREDYNPQFSQLREQRTDFYYSPARNVVPLLSFAIYEAFRKPLRFVPVEDSLDFTLVTLQDSGDFFTSSRQVSSRRAKVVKGLQNFLWKW